VNEQEDPKALARERAILGVLAGRTTVTQAAQDLGVSRKTFYGWRDRARTAMRAALADRPTGRPPLPLDPQKEALQTELERLDKERRVLEGRLCIRKAILEVLDLPAGATKKKGGV
jgi:transposase-like protein